MEFINILLSKATLSWFSHILEKNSPILADLDNFLAKFNNIFRDTDKMQIATPKL